MDDRPDLYVLLGIAPDASALEVREAYRTRVRLLHPDRFDKSRNPVEWAAANAMLRDLNAAYSVLSDATRRARYDEAFRTPSTRGGQAVNPPRSQQEAAGPQQTTVPPAHLRQAVRGYWPFVYGSLLLLVLWLAATNESRDGDNTNEVSKAPAAPSATEASNPEEIHEAADVALPADGELRSVSLPPVAGCEEGIQASALPSNGTHWRYRSNEPLAPLEVRTSDGGQFLVKLEQAGEPVASMLVMASSTAELLVPLGRYELKYAVGDGQFWCGEKASRPFGNETSFFRANHAFDFRLEGDHYSGYVVELILQQGGNLPTEQLLPEEW